MPLELILHTIENGLPPWLLSPPRYAVATAATVAVLAATKLYTRGRRNTSERNMHGRVVLMTGGTSGIGAEVALALASRGAQLVLLTHRSPGEDPLLVEYIDDLREASGNQLVYAEQVDLRDLHSVRRFATKWIDNSPPRRLDMIVLCAATSAGGGGGEADGDMAEVERNFGVDRAWMVNYVANFHLLGILSPAIRAQPFDRDVRIVLATCPAYIGAPSLKAEGALPAFAAKATEGTKKGAGKAAKDGKQPKDTPATQSNTVWTPSQLYARSKLALMTFAVAYQKHLDAYKRPDELPMNARVVLVDPGWCRTAGTRSWLTGGSLWGLALYLIGYLVPWLLLKSALGGAQSFLHATMDEALASPRRPGVKFVKECMEVDFARRDIADDAVAKALWESTDKLVEEVEKELAKRRAKEKAKRDRLAEEEEQAEQVKDVESLVDAIKKAKKQKEAETKKPRDAKQPQQKKAD